MKKDIDIKKSMFIVGLEKFFMIFFQFITSIILARMLMPSDFGTVAMLAIFISLSSMLVDSGFGGSLVYHKDVDFKDYSTVFWLNLGISLCLYILMFVSADQIAQFYQTPILKDLIKVLGLTVVFHSIGMVQYSILYKELEFKKIAIVSIVAYVISAIVAVFFAYIGLGVWALIAQQVLGPFIRTCLFFFLNQFIPRFYFSKEIVLKHWRFGSGLFFSSLLRIVYDNMYLQLIGKYCSIVNAGYYNQAKKLKDIPQNLFSQTFETSLFPLLCKIADDVIFIKKMRKITRVFSFICSPLFVMITILSNEIVSILLGEKWLSAVWILKLISIGAIFYVFESVNRSALKAKGLSVLIFKIDLVKRVFFIILMLMLVSHFELKGIVISFIINSFIGWCINSYYLSRYSSYKFSTQLIDVLKYVIICTVIFVVVICLKQCLQISNDYLTVIITSILFLIMYIVVNIMLHDDAILFIYKIVKNKIF